MTSKPGLVAAEGGGRLDPSGVFQSAKPWQMARRPGQPSHLWCWWCGRPGEAFQGASIELRIYLTVHCHMKQCYVCIFANSLALFNLADRSETWVQSRMTGRGWKPDQPQFQGQVLQWPMEDHVDKGPLQAQSQGRQTVLSGNVWYPSIVGFVKLMVRV